ncbi:MAG: alpha/beta fold hydrolase [Pseudohongiellaceae bacterium]|jgi:pimeloyl-ACP methyl ester carboxylesterase
MHRVCAFPSRSAAIKQCSATLLSALLTIRCTALGVATTLGLFLMSLSAHADLLDEVEHGFADNNGVKIHYAAVGEGPLVIMIHGFPDYWYSWRHQMEGLKDSHRVVAIDQRGYNQSDKPTGEENYHMRHLVSDVAAVIRHHGEDSATIVGHDWGGMVSWQFAFAMPQMVDRLIILNLPHPNGMGRELLNNSDQQQNSAYARAFIQGSPSDPDIFFGGPMTPQSLSGWVTDAEARPLYIEAFERSDFDAMLAYYKQNYPRGTSNASAPPPAPQLNVPLLVFHGLQDTALHSDGLNNTWDWNDADTTIVSAPHANHFVQQDAAELVTDTMKWWLAARPQ